MNAQSNHPISNSISDTTDPQFLGPEAGQQAGGESHTRSELDANGSELHRYFSVARCLDLGEVERGDSLSSGR